MTRLTITRPDDWHLHLRDGDEMRSVLAHTTQRFARAIVMPNLSPPIVSVEAAHSYKKRILAACSKGARFEPLMTLYLTDNTKPEEIKKAKESGAIYGVKYYPAGATTNSDLGVTDINKCAAVFSAMEKLRMPLLLHGEVSDPDVDIFDRERIFIDRILMPLLQQFPELRIVLEHITTKEAVHFVKASGKHVGATITAHHLLLNRNAILAGGIKPHHYCLPILKREEHRLALIEAVSSGNPKFFLGTDSAPHAKEHKESACGCAGIYTAHAAIELYTEAFSAANALDRLDAFASVHGPLFYELPRNQETITLVQESWEVPKDYAFGASKLIPLRTGGKMSWKLI